MDLELLMEFSFGLIITVAVIMSVGSIILLRPVFKHLGEFLESKVDERRNLGRVRPEQFELLLDSVEGMEARLDAIEQRQAFTDRLLEARIREP